MLGALGVLAACLACSARPAAQPCAALFVEDPFFGGAVFFGLTVVFVGCALTLIGWELKHRSWWTASWTIAAIGVLVATGLTVNWSLIAVRGFFYLHHGKFTEVAKRAVDGQLVCAGAVYGDPLPKSVRHLSINGDATVVGDCQHPQGVVLPRAFHFLDGGAGYVWYSGQPIDGWDLNGDPLSTCVSLGGGWYWGVAEGCS